MNTLTHSLRSPLDLSRVRECVYDARRVFFKEHRVQANTIVLGVSTVFDLCQTPEIEELRRYVSPALLCNSGLPSRIFGLRVVEIEDPTDDEGKPYFTIGLMPPEPIAAIIEATEAEMERHRAAMTQILLSMR